MPLTSVNLLPQHFVERNLARKLWRFWLRLLAVVALLCSVSIAVARGVSEQARRVALASHQATEPIRQVVEGNRQLQSRAMQLSELSLQHSNLRADDSAQSVLALLTNIRQSQDHQTQVVSVELTNRSPSNQSLPIATRFTQTPSVPAHAADGLLRVTFIVRDGQRATEVMRSLRTSGLFQQVILDSSIEQVSDSHQMTFTVLCHF